MWHLSSSLAEIGELFGLEGSESHGCSVCSVWATEKTGHASLTNCICTIEKLQVNSFYLNGDGVVALPQHGDGVVALPQHEKWQCWARRRWEECPGLSGVAKGSVFGRMQDFLSQSRQVLLLGLLAEHWPYQQPTHANSCCSWHSWQVALSGILRYQVVAPPICTCYRQDMSSHTLSEFLFPLM